MLPETFAGCLHETAALIVRLPFLEKLVHAMEIALRLWCRGGNLRQWQAARDEVLEASAAATGSSSGTTFGHSDYLRKAVSEYLLRTRAMTATAEIFIASLGEPLAPFPPNLSVTDGEVGCFKDDGGVFCFRHRRRAFAPTSSMSA